MRVRWRPREPLGTMAGMSDSAPDQSPTELLRLLNNLARTGRVEQVRAGRPARCRVRTGELLTTWVPWFCIAAGGNDQTRHWRAPAINEPCLLIAPGGDLAQAVAIPGMYSEDMPQGSQNPGVERHDFSGSDFWEHDRVTGKLTLQIAQEITFQCGASSITLSPDAIALASPALTHNGKDISGEHVHSGVESGLANTGGPV